jgi:sn-glycerol 3-phosphate transport system substrate-binding protein
MNCQKRKTFLPNIPTRKSHSTRPWFAAANAAAVREALEDEVQQVLSGKKRPAEALTAAQENADQLLKPYVDETAMKVP